MSSPSTHVRSSSSGSPSSTSPRGGVSLSPAPSSSPRTPVSLSPMPSVGASPKPDPFTFSKGHGTTSETGPLGKGKTPLRLSGVQSVESQRAKAVSGGQVTLGSGAPVHVWFVPRTSVPNEYRAIGTKTSGGDGKHFTSFPFDAGNASLHGPIATAGLDASKVVDAPTSPRGVK